ncbi:MAG: transketolase [Candidatus Moranbacteria bacterium CG_4_9_14_3_um_filter_45_14]|nr:MAG: transketolase [Candidatus Moranbacteria bacterium CG_4_9_14_3_um_filter_45_14]
MSDIIQLEKLAKLIRYWSLLMSTEAKSGHPTSSLSATDLMTVLFFGNYLRFDTEDIQNPNNDRIIFSKGHASPLFYALWTVAGEIPQADLSQYRTFGSSLEGHPMPTFRMTEVAAGSLGQGLSVGVGMALSAKYLDKTEARIYVLLGDSEMAEGSVWEAMNSATYYGLDNLVGIVDINRLGQRGETMFGHDIDEYEKRAVAFGWQTIVIDGHSLEEIVKAYETATKSIGKPVMILAKTIKGKGVSFLEDKEGWHGKALSKEEFEQAKRELGEVDLSLRGRFASPGILSVPNNVISAGEGNVHIDSSYRKGELVATRQAYGTSLATLGASVPEIVALDAEVSNSTFSDIFKKRYPDRFFEMFIAEQNMVGVAIGLARRGKIPFVSTFATFFSRAFDQIRMAQYSEANVKFVGSHAGVSIGQDGASQMGLEDIALFRSVLNSVVLYPADAVATERLVEIATKHKGLVYIRTTRAATPVLYDSTEQFPIGGSKTLRSSNSDVLTLVSAGITLFEALQAADGFIQKGIGIRVIDLYSIKPLDREALLLAAKETQAIITIEDHYPAGGIGEAVSAELSRVQTPVHNLSVMRTPHSGSPEGLLQYENISRMAIQEKIQSLL